MKQQIKGMCLTKQSIVTSSFTIMLLIYDLKGLISEISSNLFIIVTFIALLILGLIVHFNMSDGTQNREKGGNMVAPNTEKGARKGFQIQKMIFSLMIPLLILLITSLVYLKYADVYYVVLEKNLTMQKAIKLKDKVNNDINFMNIGLSTRIIPQPNSNKRYEVILNQGFITHKKANENLVKIKEMRTEFDAYVSKPIKNINYLRKIKYLQNHLPFLK